MPLTRSFARLTGARTKDLSQQEARNGVIHTLALILSKGADGLIDPKLVLSWLLTHLGAPGIVIGALVPVRESGALLPQLAFARKVETMAQRKYVWALGSVVQGLAACGIALCVILFDGAVAGWSVLACVAVLAIARAASSVSFKDVLARTIAKGRRGAVTGFATGLAAVVAFSFGLLMALGIFDVAVPVLAAAVALGGAAFVVAGLLFLRLDEPEHGSDAAEPRDLAAMVRPLRDDPQLQIFIAARAGLTVTALAPPFIIMLSTASGDSALDQLGPMVMASTAAAFLSSYIWGRLSDHSSRQTLMAAGALSGVVLLVVGIVGLGSAGLGGAWGAGLAIFAAQTAYEGVRQGRKLHLTDMAEDDFRARYTALSNTLIGVALMAGGLFGLLADRFGPAPLLIVFAAISLVGALIASRLDEVQQD